MLIHLLTCLLLSENLLALKAPNTTKCDFCQVSFCGISVHERCTALPLTSQQPQGMSDIADFVQSSEIYDCFDNNTAEVEIMLDFLATRQISPKEIYRDVSSLITVRMHHTYWFLGCDVHPGSAKWVQTVDRTGNLCGKSPCSWRNR